MNPRPDVALHPAHILIVDDEHPNRRLLEVMLKPEGFLLLTAASGEEALAIVAQQPPDLILLDIMMPGMDGYQVAAEIKGNPATRNIPIIMVTAMDGRNAKMLGLKAGAEDFLTKPIERAELCVRVRNLLRLKAYGDYFDKYSQTLEGEVVSRTAELAERTRQAAVLAEQAALLDLAQDAIVVRDMQKRVLFWSHGAEVLYGWLSQEAIGRDLRELLKAELLEPEEEIEAALQRQGRWEGEVIHHKRDGTRLNVAMRLALQLDADGAPDRILAINTDITNRKEAEKALEQSRQEQMRFKNEFLSHVSHELRSPLTAIKQFTTILLGGLAGELNKEQLEYENIVLKNVQQLQSMINELLDVTHLDTGKLAVEPESVPVSEAVTDTLNTLQVTARAKGIRLSSDVPSVLPAALADQAHFRQILTILLDNAIKFTPNGGAVKIQARLSDENSRLLLLEVSDTGCGFSPEIAERIFERLYQAPEANPGSRQGLGLGLYICKELVTRQGGRIWVKSHPQKGSTFSFTLPVFPLNNSIAGMVVNLEEPVRPQVIPEVFHSKKKVLIVEDDADVRLGYDVLLKANHYNTFFAADGSSSIKEARTHQPDLIILDLGLPAGNGFVVLNWLRGDPYLAAIPVLVVSARDLQANKDLALDSGARAYLQKPWNDDQLLAIILRLTSQSKPPLSKAG